jgi:hypothetical protein
MWQIFALPVHTSSQLQQVEQQQDRTLLGMLMLR